MLCFHTARCIARCIAMRPRVVGPRGVPRAGPGLLCVLLQSQSCRRTLKPSCMSWNRSIADLTVGASLHGCPSPAVLHHQGIYIVFIWNARDRVEARSSQGSSSEWKEIPHPHLWLPGKAAGLAGPQPGIQYWHLLTQAYSFPQMNLADSERMAGVLEAAGYVCAEDPAVADVLVYNTCSIREKAEVKVYSALGKQVGAANASAHCSSRPAGSPDAPATAARPSLKQTSTAGTMWCSCPGFCSLPMSACSCPAVEMYQEEGAAVKGPADGGGVHQATPATTTFAHDGLLPAIHSTWTGGKGGAVYVG